MTAPSGISSEALTAREREVLALVAAGKTNGEIAAALGVSFPTAKAHVSHILTKLGVESREEAARWWDAHGQPEAPSVWALWVRGVSGLPWARIGTGAGVTAVVAAAVAIGVVAVAMIASRGGDSSPAEDLATATEEQPSATAAPSATGTPPPAPSLTPVRLVDGIPDGAVGPLVVYWEGRAGPGRELVVYDAGQQKGLSAFRQSEGLTAIVSGTEILINEGNRIAAYALDGSSRVIYEAQANRLTDHLIVSGDGDMLAVVQFEPGTATGLFEGDLLFIDAVSGEVVASLSRTGEAFEGFGGFLILLDWLPDRSGVLAANAHTHGFWSVSAVRLDGSVQLLLDGEAYPSVSPDGRYIAYSIGDPIEQGCIGTEVRRIEIRDGATNALVSGLEEEGSRLVFRGWAPSGESTLVSFSPVTSDPCIDDGSAEVARVVSAADGSSRDVPSIDEVYQEWYGAPLVTFVCDDDGVVPVYGVGWSPICYAPSGAELPVELHIGGVPVATGAEFTILGYVEVE